MSTAQQNSFLLVFCTGSLLFCMMQLVLSLSLSCNHERVLEPQQVGQNNIVRYL